jgi:hypothetical protein
MVCSALWEVHTFCVSFYARHLGIENSLVSFKHTLNSRNSGNNIYHIHSFPNASVCVARLINKRHECSGNILLLHLKRKNLESWPDLLKSWLRFFHGLTHCTSEYRERNLKETPTASYQILTCSQFVIISPSHSKVYPYAVVMYSSSNPRMNQI